ncbi:hypothetical protein BC829DRAFT_416969 [Chytridium lagenaria]|nr:hypothetical protein BC829DRAFT_416969 [Chytridium lagenaria]
MSSSSKKTPPSSSPSQSTPQTDQGVLLDQISRLNIRLDSLLDEIKGLRDDNSRLQKRLDAKDEEINRLTRQNIPPPIETPTLPTPTVPAATPMDTEDGEVLEALSTTKLAAFKADLTKTVVSEILGAMKDAGLTNLSTRHSTPRRPSPKVFSEHFDTTAHRQPAGPMSFAAAARQIARGDATPEHAARMVFRSTYPRSTIPGITNLYMRGYAEPGPLRYTIIRNALLTLGISTGVLDMSFHRKICCSPPMRLIQSRIHTRTSHRQRRFSSQHSTPLEVPDLVD